jgi:hypothetical protein
MAHDDVLHLVGCDVGALERRADGGRAVASMVDRPPPSLPMGVRPSRITVLGLP